MERRLARRARSINKMHCHRNSADLRSARRMGGACQAGDALAMEAGWRRRVRFARNGTAPLSAAGGRGRDEGRPGKISTACGPLNKRSSFIEIHEFRESTR